MADYDAKEITKYYDTFGLKEWDRLVSNPVEEVSLYIHNHYLRELIKPNDKILEIGTGPGRFTKDYRK